MNLKLAFAWPEHHVAAAWWIGVILAAPWWMARFWRYLQLLPIWGSKYARHQRTIKIRVLERLHEDTNRLILYVLRDVLTIAFDLTLVAFMVAILTHFQKVPPRSIVVSACIFLGSSLIGNVVRLRAMVNDLMNYDAAVARLKAKQD